MKLLRAAAAAAIASWCVAVQTSASPTKFGFQSPVSFAGTGCRDTEAVVDWINNSSDLRVRFDRYSTSRQARVSCRFVIPIEVAPGYQISQLIVDWVDYVEGTGQLKRKFSFAGKSLQSWRTSHFNKPKGDDFTVRDYLRNDAFSISCGGQHHIGVRSELRAKGEKNFIALDNMDFAQHNGIIFKAKYKKC